jgi:dihydrofolate reductase
MKYMEKPRISIISAIARKDRAIGKDNRLLWAIPEDMRHFRALTTGHTVIMGENTFKSIGRPLPNRTNIILSLNEHFDQEGCLIVRSIEEALDMAKRCEAEEIFIIGGASIYKQFIPFVDRLYLTLVEGEYEADTFFPEYGEFSRVISEEKVDNGKHTFAFVVLEKY